jgi:hypothetical protein
MTCAFLCPCIWAMEKSEITKCERGSLFLVSIFIG